ncbi:serine/threonine protein phosphatase, partial [Streptomyces sp. SID4982]|nr:serine/threonine protein phosphatase [Streptomyces sp. SID4982]
MTEQPTSSCGRPQPGVDPAVRGALLGAPAQARGGAGTGKNKKKERPVNGPEHSQPAAAEPMGEPPARAKSSVGEHRPRPAPESIPAQPGAEQE